MQTRSSPSLSTLHSLARSAGLVGFERLPKRVLFERLQQQFSEERMHRTEGGAVKRAREDEAHDAQASDAAACRKSRRGKKQKRAKSEEQQPINDRDPIMFTELGEHRFVFVRPNGTKVQYNVESLVDYILSTGDFSEPETRLPFSDQDLKRIDQLAANAGLQKQSVYHAKKSPQMFADMKFRRDALLGLERCAGEVVVSMMQLVEDPNADDVQMCLVMREFPQFADYWHQIDDADKEFAKQCMKHFKLYLKGPPNKPTQDPYGTLELILQFMDEVERGEMPEYV